jgi:catechol 2,3-dioxygenase-like lactoylglutathione lyase family enzyme
LAKKVGMKKIVAAIIFLFTANLPVTHAQTDQHNLDVSLVAIQVVDLDSCIDWYTRHLDFKIVEQKEFKDYGMRLAILSLGNVELELVETKAALDKAVALKKAAATVITGFAKITFTVADVRNLYKKLEMGKANIVFKLSPSNRNTELHHFIVTDNEGNWLQFIGK